MDEETLKYCLSIYQDTRQELITREEAGIIADIWEKEVMDLPVSLSEGFIEGWEAACQTLQGALRFKEYSF